MVRWLLVALALTGCDKIFGFATVPGVPADAAPDASMDGTWREVTAGASHTCAIRIDDTLWCWGRNDDGQLGIGTMDLEHDTPVQVAGAWSHVATNDRTTCAIDKTGTLYCWGLSDYGEAGIVQGIVSAPNKVDDETWSIVTAGNSFTCGITTDGVAKCWGYNVDGELGTADMMTGATPRPIDSPLTFIHIDAGAAHACAIAKTDASLWCWGQGVFGQLGQGDGSAHTSPVQVGTDAWLAVSAADRVTCGVLASGHLRCWGTGYADELGNTATISQPSPGIVGTDTGGWVDVEMSRYHACALHEDGAAWCWGENDDLQLANVNLPARDPVPTAVPGGSSSWLAIATGQHHFCGIGSDHALWCMGRISDGALGDGTGSLTTPVKVMTTATQLVAGYNSTCAVDATNARECWGDNQYYQLGDGTAELHDTPTHIGSGGSELAIGTEATCAVDGTGHLQCAGASTYYEIDPNKVLRPTLTDTATSDAPWSTVTLTTHTCAITAGTNALYCWGYGPDGEVGDGFGASEPNPSHVGVDTWSQVAAADAHTCGITTAGAVECWGYGVYGELGDGMRTSYLTPQPVMTTATPRTIYAAGNGSCLLAADGSLACWGYNDYGQLGTGPVATVYAAPTLVTGTYLDVALGRRHSCAIASDRSLWCWGDNSYGQLGDGTLTSTLLPGKIGSAMWQHVAVGDYHSCGVQTDGSVWCWGANHLGAAGVSHLRTSFARLP